MHPDIAFMSDKAPVAGGSGVPMDMTNLPIPTGRACGRRHFLSLGATLALSALAPTGLAGCALFSDDITTGIGETKTIELPDGSLVELDADSAVAIDLGERLRKVTLRRGRAAVEISGNDARPFRLHYLTARMLATTKSLNRYDYVVAQIRDAQATLSVIRGAVAMRITNDGPIIYPAAGRKVFFEVDVDRLESRAAKTGDTSWRKGQLVFEDQPLGEVIADIGRYRHGSVLSMDAALNALLFTGKFAAADTDSILAAIDTALPVACVELTPLLVMIFPT
jgi:transmembrane sensor